MCYRRYGRRGRYTSQFYRYGRSWTMRKSFRPYRRFYRKRYW